MFLRIYSILKILFFIIVPIILILLPATHFDGGQSICLSVLIFDTECLACGLTRASMHLIHFDFHEAYHFNPLVFIVMPVLSFMWARAFFKDVKFYRENYMKKNLQA